MQIKDKNKSRRGNIAMAVACVLLQIMISPNVDMGNGRINFLLVFVGVLSLWHGGREAVIYGFAAGLLYDLLSTSPVGLMAALFTILAYGLGIEERDRFADGFVTCLTSFGTGAFVVILAYHLAMLLLGESSGLLDLVLLRVLPTFALTFVVYLPFAYYMVRRNTGGASLGRGQKAQVPRGTHYDLHNL